MIKYRKKVIFENLKHAFPEKGEDEIDQIAGKFYRHLSDMIFETLKLQSINTHELDKRIKFNGLELPEKYFKEGKSMILLGIHYNN